MAEAARHSGARGKDAPRWAIPYVRVSTEEQAKKGYSLADQADRLRSWIKEEGYEVLEEVVDDGYSAASLVTPGIDRIRKLVSAHDDVTILTVYRDRFSREPMYRGVLEKEFAERGAMIRATDDRGDGSPEGELANAIIDQVGKYERAKTTERSKAGKIRKAREGKVVITGTPNFGFRLDATGDYYEVDEERMPVVLRIFRAVGMEGISTHGVAKTLEREDVPAPGGGKHWYKRRIKDWIQNDVYKPHTHGEIRDLESEGLIRPEVVARLDPNKLYGIWWYNRRRTETERVRPKNPSTVGSGRYPKRTKVSYRDRREFVAVPVPDPGIPREWVDAARAVVAQYRSPSKAAGRFWELSGALMRCARCGRAMEAVDRYYRLKSGEKGVICYYRCREGNRRKDTCDNNKSIRSDRAHPAVWRIVSGLLSEPERLREGLERMIDEERQGLRGDPEQEARLRHKDLEKLERRRSGYIDLAADEIMGREELRAKLAEVDEAREQARREIRTLKERRETVSRMEAEKEALIESYAGMIPGALEDLDPEKRHRIYKLLRLRVLAHPDKSLEVHGVLGKGPLGDGATPDGHEEYGELGLLGFVPTSWGLRRTPTAASPPTPTTTPSPCSSPTVPRA